MEAKSKHRRFRCSSRSSSRGPPSSAESTRCRRSFPSEAACSTALSARSPSISWKSCFEKNPRHLKTAPGPPSVFLRSLPVEGRRKKKAAHAPQVICGSEFPAFSKRARGCRNAEDSTLDAMSHLTIQTVREVMKVMLESPCFDRVANKMKVVSANPGKVVCEMKVEEQHTNRGGILHGGLTATLVDIVSTAALMYTERGAPGVSVDMNITYMSSAKIGEEILITAEVLKQGKTLGFANVNLTDKTTGRLIAQGRHTKHLGFKS